MPIYCPIHNLAYDACKGCRNRDDRKCTASPFYPMALASFLTTEERLAILEDNLTQKAETNITKKDFQNLQRRILLLEEKLTQHIDKSAEPKSKYN